MPCSVSLLLEVPSPLDQHHQHPAGLLGKSQPCNELGGKVPCRRTDGHPGAAPGAPVE